MYGILQVDLSWDMGHRIGAHSASQRAKKWATVAIISGIIAITVSVVFIIVIVSIGTTSVHNNS